MIIFEKVRWKNFLSTGNTFSEINLTNYRTNLIVGANGAGKSTILDALTFSLFGKPFRKINKGMLVNSINEKDTIVEIEFSIGKSSYKVIRGIKPNKFEIYCNGTLWDQESSVAEQQVEFHIDNDGSSAWSQIVDAAVESGQSYQQKLQTVTAMKARYDLKNGGGEPKLIQGGSATANDVFDSKDQAVAAISAIDPATRRRKYDVDPKYRKWVDATMNRSPQSIFDS